MLKSAIEKIIDLAKIEQFKIGGIDFTSKQIHKIQPPAIANIEINTLTGFVHYMKNSLVKDGYTLDDVMVVVTDHENVELYTKVDSTHKNREHILSASRKLHQDKFAYGQQYDTEKFIINMQSYFQKTTTRDLVLKLVGNVKSENVTASSDDGITQTVEQKVGVTLVSKETVPNPVNLVPYRTFLEVEQPASDFILRAQKGREGSLPTFALYEADGGAWKLQAIQKIAEYLKKELEGVQIIH